MESSPVTESIQEPVASLESRINQLEAMLSEVYPTFCRLYSHIDFVQMTPEILDAPYSTHSLPIPYTKLTVSFTTDPPRLVIGTPQLRTSGLDLLQWGQVLDIQYPEDTKLVSFCYGGGIGIVEWFDDAGVGHMLPNWLASTEIGHTSRFHLARHEDIRSIRIMGRGEMSLHSPAIGIPESVILE